MPGEEFQEAHRDERPAHVSRMRVWIVGAAGVALVAAAALGVWRSVVSENPTIEAAPETTTSSSAPTITAATLVPYRQDPALLHHPTLLPAGWEICRVLDEIDRGDRFCDPSGEAFVEVAVKRRVAVRPEDGTPIPDAPGTVWLRRSPDEIGVEMLDGTYLVVRAEGVGGDQLLEVAMSIPVVSDREVLYGEYELPLDIASLTDDQLAGLVARVAPEAQVANRGAGQAQVFTDTMVLSAFITDQPSVPELALTVPRPRLVDLDRPVVIGTSEGRRRSFAIWDQGGHGWRLEGEISPDDLTSLVRDVIAAVDEIG